MNIGTQYYRPPFPSDKYWENDMKKMVDSGLNTVQLWVLWGWVEAKPGEFRYDDYDRLVEIAEKTGLGIVMSTIAEIQPYWIHREVPGSEMITNLGHKVISSNRGECHFGITPGGCFDHPEIWMRMSDFIVKTVERYKNKPNFTGWDIWNELRWDVYSDGIVCYCEHTVKAYHDWLDKKFGGLDSLNKAWLRRYGQWNEIRPGKACRRPFTDMMAFGDFICHRSSEHGKKRYELVKSIDPDHPATLHGGSPSGLYGGSSTTIALNRGNDWDFADTVDGVGTSSFPKWAGMTNTSFSTRLEYTRSAAGDKLIWLSELQGGAAASGYTRYPSVPALDQQRWIWNGVACGADTILFWCWRDEVFTHEAGGFGLIGGDGLVGERLAAMKITGKILTENKTLLDAYRADRGEVGVMFSPQTYFQHYAFEGTAEKAINAIEGLCRALVRLNIPYEVVEEKHLEKLKGLKTLFLPRTLVIDDAAAEILAGFVEEGGTLVTESECGSFNSVGLWRYPEDRFTANLSGVKETSRQPLSVETIEADIGGQKVNLPVNQWVTPLDPAGGKVLASCPEGPVLVEKKVGRGSVIIGGTYFAYPYFKHAAPGYEKFVDYAIRSSGWEAKVEVISPKRDNEEAVFVKFGKSGGRRVMFVFFTSKSDEVRIRLAGGFFKGSKALDIISGEEVRILSDDGKNECRLHAPELRISVLVGD